MTRVRVLLAEDHSLVRAGFQSLLRDLHEVEVVAEAADGASAYALAEQLRPQVVLMDISMPGLSGLEATRRLRALESVRVIILTMHASEDYLTEALQAGAAGYLLKDTTLDELRQAIASVARGDYYISPAVSNFLAGSLIRRATAPPPAPEPPRDPLTARQREVLTLIAQGYTSQRIADALHISQKTAESHRAQIMERLDIHDVAGLVRYAIRHQLVSIDPHE